jgi:PAS domain S-box-containing protein
MSSAMHGSAHLSDAADIRLVVDTILGLVWSSGPDGAAEFFNRRWLEYTGLSAEQGLAWGWKAAIHPADLSRLRESFREALKRARSFEVEGRWDGEFRWFLFRGSPLLDDAGRVVKWYGTKKRRHHGNYKHRNGDNEGRSDFETGRGFRDRRP